MSATPYEDLGLAPEATPNQIRAAYRRLVMKHHPDRHGDPVQFRRVKDAYEVLSDPARRLQYDTTGTTEQMLSTRQAAETLIPQLAVEVIDSFSDPARCDLHFAMVTKVRETLRQDRESQSQAVKARDKLKSVLKRFKRKGGENMIAGALQAKIAQISTFLENNTQHQLLLAAVLDVLKDYSYTVGAEPEPETQLLENKE